MQTRVTIILDKLNISYSIIPHSRQVYTTEEAANERGVRVEQIVKCMIVKSSSDKFYIVLIPGHRKLSLKSFAKYVNEKKVFMANKEDAERITGYQVGAISPIGINKEKMEIYMDKEILSEENIALSAGRADAGILMRSKDLHRLLSADLIEVSMEV